MQRPKQACWAEVRGTAAEFVVAEVWDGLVVSETTNQLCTGHCHEGIEYHSRRTKIHKALLRLFLELEPEIPSLVQYHVPHVSQAAGGRILHIWSCGL